MGGSGNTGDGELWTTGEVADFLSDLGINRKMVSQMVNTGELAGYRRADHKWARIPAAVARAYREDLLNRQRHPAEQSPRDTLDGDAP